MKKRILALVLAVVLTMSLTSGMTLRTEADTAAPAEVSAAPEVPVAEETTAPTETPTEPAAPAEVPTEPTEAPAEPTESTEPTEAPAEPVESAESTEAPAEPVEVPTDPAETTEEPADGEVSSDEERGDGASDEEQGDAGLVTAATEEPEAMAMTLGLENEIMPIETVFPFAADDMTVGYFEKQAAFAPYEKENVVRLSLGQKISASRFKTFMADCNVTLNGPSGDIPLGVDMGYDKTFAMAWWSLSSPLKTEGTYTLKLEKGEETLESSFVLFKLEFYPYPYGQEESGGTFAEGSKYPYEGYGVAGGSLSQFKVPESTSSQGSRLGWTDQEGNSVTTATQAKESGGTLYARYGNKVTTSLTVKNKETVLNGGSTVEMGGILFGKQATLELTLKNDGNQVIKSLDAVIENGGGFQVSLDKSEFLSGQERMLTITSNTDLSVGMHSRTLRITYTSDTVSRGFIMVLLNIKVTSGSVTVTVEGATKVYGEKLTQEKLLEEGKVKVEPQVPFKNLGVTLYSDGFETGAGVSEDGYEIKATNSPNYSVTVNGKVTVTPATPIGEPAATGVKVGQKLADAILSGSFTNPNTGLPVEGTLAWEDGQQVLDTQGTHQYKWVFTPKDNNPNYTTATGMANVVVSNKTATVLKVVGNQVDSFTYDGKAHGMTFESDRPVGQEGTITVLYAPEGTPEQETEKWTAEPPVNAGKYTVHATMEGNSIYAPGDTTKTMTITPKAINFSFTYSSKIYDGTTDVKNLNVYVSNKARVSDDVRITATGKFDVPDAGSRNLSITLNSTIEGAAAANYQLPANPTYHTTGMILPAYINVTAKEITKEYGVNATLDVGSFNVEPLAERDSAEDLLLSFSSEGTKPEAAVGTYNISVSLPKGNYTLTNNNIHQATSTVLQGAMSVTKAVPMTPGVSAGEGRQGRQLKDVTLTGEFVNPHTGEVVPGELRWKGDKTLNRGDKDEGVWVFEIAEDARNNYDFGDGVYTKEGTAEITLEELTPIPLTVKSTSEPYTGKGHVLEAEVTGDGSFDPSAVKVDFVYTRHGETTPLVGEPVDVGAYDVTVTANADNIPGYGDNTVTATLTITQAAPDTSSVKKTLEVLQGTPLDALAEELGLPTGVMGEELPGAYIWTETGKVEQDGQTYHWTFDPESNNYATAEGEVTITLAPDARVLEATVYNLPEELQFEDYAAVTIPKDGSGLTAGETVTFFKGDSPVSEGVTVTETDVEKGYVIVGLDEDALGNGASTLTASITSSVKHAGNDIQCPAEPILTVNEGEVIDVHVGDTAELQATLTEGYDIVDTGFSADSGNYVEVTPEKDLLAASVKGLAAEHTHVIVTATIKHPDQVRFSGVTIDITLRVHVNVTIKPGDVVVEVERQEGAPAVSVPPAEMETLKSNVLESEDLAKIEQGIDVTIDLVVADADSTVPAADKALVGKCIDQHCPGYVVGQYLDVKLLKTVEGQSAKDIHETGKPITLVLSVPDDLKAAGRSFRIIRVHDGVAEVLADLDSDPNTITIQTNKFSTYAIAYTDKAPTTAGGTNTNTNANGTPASPKTGDDSAPGLWLGMMMLGLAGLAVCGRKLRRRKVR